MANDPAFRVAQYIRMSTEVQDLSPVVQKDAIAKYAQERGFEVVASYEDIGRSGLTLKSRPAMRQLLSDVTQVPRRFTRLLVYDVSRWGRFPDTDASAYYEYHCRLHGVGIEYVNESFPCDESPLAAVLKNLKRAMAAEYSRELKVKSRAGQEKAIQLGFQMGLLPCVGYRRMAVSRDGRRKRQLDDWERKPLASDHVRWVPGPPEELALVQRIFRLYAQTDLTIEGLRQLLTQEGQSDRRGEAFTYQKLRALLTNEAVIGNFVWGRRDEREGTRRRDGHPGISRAMSVVPPVIDPITWNLTFQKRMTRRLWRRSQTQLLEELKAAVRRNPGIGITELGGYGCAGEGVYRKFFGSFLEAARQAGRDLTLAKAAQSQSRSKAQTLAMRFTYDVEELLRNNSVAFTREPRSRVLTFANGTRLALRLIWRRRSRGGLLWFLRAQRVDEFQYALLVRMEPDDTATDLLMMPRHEFDVHPRWFEESPFQSVQRCTSSQDLLRQIRALLADPSTQGA